MHQLLTDSINCILEHKEEGAIVSAPLLLALKYSKLIKKKLFGAGYPTGQQLIKIMKDVFEHCIIIVVDVSKGYDKDLDDWLKNNKHNYTQEEIDASKDTYRAIMLASFFYGYIEFFNFFSDDVEWPKKNSPEYIDMVSGKGKYIYKLIWSKFDSFYNRKFIITIEGRRERMEQGYDDMMKIFKGVVDYWYQIKGL